MEVDVTITRKDLALVQWRLLLRDRGNLYLFIVMLAFVSVASFSSVSAYGWLIYSILTLVTALIAFLALYLFGILLQQILVSEKQGMIGPHHFEISEKGFLEKAGGTVTFTEWPGVSRVIRLKNYTYLRINFSRVHVVPRRGFESNDHYSEFVDQLEEYVDAA